jgi:hypothetical protein
MVLMLTILSVIVLPRYGSGADSPEFKTVLMHILKNPLFITHTTGRHLEGLHLHLVSRFFGFIVKHFRGKSGGEYFNASRFLQAFDNIGRE